MEVEDFFLGAMIVIVSCIFLGIITLAIMTPFVNSLGGTKGQHTGYVTAVDFNDNLIFDQDVVYFKTDTESTQEDIYCINNPDLKKRLEQYARDNVKVTLQYSNGYILWRADCNGGLSIINEVLE